ncbi:MAG: 4-hydroxythreonine-4-phosphate dehydrogenase PdxA [Acidobacteriota bacterium]|nr:4-hydroxythreonine-4-phosphate dehydrogenase PdxA [Acidobacteriota bacterium]MDH3522047.1 4-hydroxythreonine-4-phosphate dehydrogenase PdxA [Acidobacteriota bacterium]
MSVPAAPVLALTQGDPAGVGPEVALRAALEGAAGAAWRPLLVAERAALRAHAAALGIAEGDWERLSFLSAPPTREELASLPAGRLAVVDPVGEDRALALGRSGSADAAGALAALDLGADLARRRVVDGLVTAPLSKQSIARHVDPGFRGHTDYLAAACGLERYGRDYLMTFLSPDLRVALLSTHQPLAAAIAAVSDSRVGEALDCLARHVDGRIAVAGLNPHAGEGGLLGSEDDAVLRPAVAAARGRGVDAHGPESADSLFARARQGEFDWVLALYHDQGLIAVKTAAFGSATNWTMGLPYVRTSVDHGTAFHLAGSGQVRLEPMRAVVSRTLELVAARAGRPRS